MNQITMYYLEKEKNKECILLYKSGLFYKAYESDAILVSYLLNLNLKHRNNAFYEVSLSEHHILELETKHKIDYYLDNKFYHFIGNEYLTYFERATNKLKLDAIYQNLLTKINEGEDISYFLSIGEEV